MRSSLNRVCDVRNTVDVIFFCLVDLLFMVLVSDNGSGFKNEFFCAGIQLDDFLIF